MRKLRKSFLVWLLVPCITFTSCDEDTLNTVLDVIDEIFNMLGYNMEDEKVDDQETDDVDDATVTETKVDWSAKFPPIGNQGSYGTCVAWATGYNLKSALNVIDGTWSNASSTSTQVSPVDLWHIIPSSGKSTSCNGSNFEPAFQAMIDKNVATMSSVPFTNQKMTCDGVSGKGTSGKKLAEYRIVAYSKELSGNNSYGMTVNNIKNHLKEGPLVIGAKLGEKFMSWKTNSVIYDDTDNYKGQHAYHAMALVGYDDSKGNNGAFRLRNSWGATDWGDNGCIWVDYDFFVTQFCFGVWSASNTKSSTASASLKSSSTNDVKVVVNSDVELANGNRKVTYTVTNNGASTISTSNYPIVYLLFKAKHFAERYFVMEKAENATIKPNQSVTLSHIYAIPAEASDGKYSLALIADPCNIIGDKNRDDNFAFVLGAENIPLLMVQNKLLDVPQQPAEMHSLVCSANKNAYRNEELQAALARAAK